MVKSGALKAREQVHWTCESDERRASLASLEEGQAFLVRCAHKKS
jgi:hypothetical protein